MISAASFLSSSSKSTRYFHSPGATRMTAQSTTATIRSQLEQTAGVTPSDDWLTACQAHLRLTNEVAADAVLHQVLYADLRDVVRPTVSGSVSRTSTPESSSLLRNALQQSMRSETRKTILPTRFSLMVQVEELLDVSLNADARYSVGPASASNPTPIGNQKARCLKLYLSDGHRPPIHLIGMEIAPIPNLSVNSLAGIKVLLKGTVIIRHGMLQLHPGCATVLGGSVADLVVVQKKALEQAQRVAGIGVDPTVKALIWNKDTTEDELQEEEGEGASGDVAAPPRAAVVQQQQLPPQPTARITVQQQQNRVVPRQPQHFSAPPPRHNNVSTLTPQPPRRNQPLPVPPQATRTQHHSVAAVSQATSSTRSTGSSSRSINPYAKNASTSASQNSANRPAAAASSSRSVAARATIVAPSGSSAMNLSNRSTQKENRSSSAAVTAARVPQSSSTQATSIKSITTTQSSQDSTCSVTGSRLKEPLSFEELVALVKRAVQNRQLYELNVDKVFVVPAKMNGAHTYFNIEKRKKRKSANKKSKGEKYEYVMNSHFTGPAAKSQLITVVVAGDILRSHFELSPGDMRKLSREDRQTSQKLVEDGGRSAMLELSTLRSWEITLYATSEEFFGEPPSSLDGEVPILRVLRQSD